MPEEEDDDFPEYANEANKELNEKVSNLFIIRLN